MCPSRSHQSLCVRAEKSLQERVCKAFQSKSLRSSHRGEGGGHSTQNHKLDTDREEEERSDILHICIHPHTRTHTKPSLFFFCVFVSVTSSCSYITFSNSCMDLIMVSSCREGRWAIREQWCNLVMCCSLYSVCIERYCLNKCIEENLHSQFKSVLCACV